MKTTITTYHEHHLELGDLIGLDNGREVKVVGGTRTQLVVRELRWYERLVLWIRRHARLRFRGFWARVWRR